MKFAEETYFEDSTGEFICKKFKMNNEEVSEDYFNEELEEFEGPDDEELEENDFCDCVNCTLDRFTMQLQEITGGCPGCIRDVLCDFLDEIVDHIVVEDINNDE